MILWFISALDLILVCYKFWLCYLYTCWVFYGNLNGYNWSQLTGSINVNITKQWVDVAVDNTCLRKCYMWWQSKGLYPLLQELHSSCPTNNLLSILLTWQLTIYSHYVPGLLPMAVALLQQGKDKREKDSDKKLSCWGKEAEFNRNQDSSNAEHLGSILVNLRHKITILSHCISWQSSTWNVFIYQIYVHLISMIWVFVLLQEPM